MVSGLEPDIAFIGGMEWKQLFHTPVRPGDRLVATRECIEKRPSRSKTDRGIARFLSIMSNQRGEKVMTSEMTALVSRNPALPGKAAERPLKSDPWQANR